MLSVKYKFMRVDWEHRGGNLSLLGTCWEHHDIMIYFCSFVNTHLTFTS